MVEICKERFWLCVDRLEDGRMNPWERVRKWCLVQISGSTEYENMPLLLNSMFVVTWQKWNLQKLSFFLPTVKEMKLVLIEDYLFLQSSFPSMKENVACFWKEQFSFPSLLLVQFGLYFLTPFHGSECASLRYAHITEPIPHPTHFSWLRHHDRQAMKVRGTTMYSSGIQSFVFIYSQM
jgi:hypothetical protein